MENLILSELPPCFFYIFPRIPTPHQDAGPFFFRSISSTMCAVDLFICELCDLLQSWAALAAERRCWAAEARAEGAAAVSQSAWNCPVLMLFRRSRCTRLQLLTASVNDNQITLILNVYVICYVLFETVSRSLFYLSLFSVSKLLSVGMDCTG